MNCNSKLKLGDHIKSLRKKRTLTREQLAEGICSVSHISRIESSNRQPSSILLVQIAKKLGVTPDYLLSEIESEYSTEIRIFIDKLILMVERHEFQSIYDAILKNDVNLNNNDYEYSLVDTQIIETLRVYSFHILNGGYREGISKFDDILNITYVPGNIPTDVEFGIMELRGFFLYLDGNLEASYEYMISIKEYISKINFIRSDFIVPRFYSHLIMICLDTNHLIECESHIEFTVEFCKRKNTQHHLRELYYLKSELLYRNGDIDKSKIWYDKSLQLHDLIKTSDKEYFVDFVNQRTINLQKNQKQ